MSDREKLIELIRHEVVPYFAERIADHLIANGVTFDKDTNVPSWMNYCPNCGADMRERREGE